MLAICIPVYRCNNLCAEPLILNFCMHVVFVLCVPVLSSAIFPPPPILILHCVEFLPFYFSVIYSFLEELN